eukprot:TRINITY_DN587_c1_g1_i1.p1 TRINITY_DN587_c1_g1~~TRINITY_DN587_c1_g1_i1.p1  ORF type:complete len:820 (+),score=329.75 TRINITY_DN587_c1_g1_i1:47-2506(+)
MDSSVIREELRQKQLEKARKKKERLLKKRQSLTASKSSKSKDLLKTKRKSVAIIKEPEIKEVVEETEEPVVKKTKKTRKRKESLTKEEETVSHPPKRAKRRATIVLPKKSPVRSGSSNPPISPEENVKKVMPLAPTPYVKSNPLKEEEMPDEDGNDIAGIDSTPAPSRFYDNTPMTTSTRFTVPFVSPTATEASFALDTETTTNTDDIDSIFAQGMKDPELQSMFMDLKNKKNQKVAEETGEKAEEVKPQETPIGTLPASPVPSTVVIEEEEVFADELADLEGSQLNISPKKDNSNNNTKNNNGVNPPTPVPEPAVIDILDGKLETPVGATIRPVDFDANITIVKGDGERSRPTVNATPLKFEVDPDVTVTEEIFMDDELSNEMPEENDDDDDDDKSKKSLCRRLFVYIKRCCVVLIGLVLVILAFQFGLAAVMTVMMEMNTVYCDSAANECAPGLVNCPPYAVCMQGKIQGCIPDFVLQGHKCILDPTLDSEADLQHAQALAILAEAGGRYACRDTLMMSLFSDEIVENVEVSLGDVRERLHDVSSASDIEFKKAFNLLLTRIENGETTIVWNRRNPNNLPVKADETPNLMLSDTLRVRPSMWIRPFLCRLEQMITPHLAILIPIGIVFVLGLCSLGCVLRKNTMRKKVGTLSVRAHEVLYEKSLSEDKEIPLEHLKYHVLEEDEQENGNALWSQVERRLMADSRVKSASKMFGGAKQMKCVSWISPQPPRSLIKKRIVRQQPELSPIPEGAVMATFLGNDNVDVVCGIPIACGEEENDVVCGEPIEEIEEEEEEIIEEEDTTPVEPQEELPVFTARC